MTRRGSLAIVALLLTLGAAVAACGTASHEVTITIRYSAFDPPQLTVPRGVPVTFILVNDDPIDHEWLVGDAEFHEAHRTGTHQTHGSVPTEVTIPALSIARTTVTFETAGMFAYVCHLPQHEAYGMVGVLTVDG